MQDITANLLDTLITLVVISPLLLAFIRFLKARTKNAHIETALNFAEIVVQSIGQANRILTPSQRNQAVGKLKERLASNGLDKHFTDSEVETYINNAAIIEDKDNEDK